MAAGWSDWGSVGNDVHRTSLQDAADVAAVEATPPLAHLPGSTIYACLNWAAATYPARAAIVQLASATDERPETIDFATYLHQVEQAANLFRHAAGGAPAVVAVIAPYLPQALVAMWGGATAGRYVPINPFLEVDHVAGIMRAAGTDVLVIATAAAGPGVWDRHDELVAAVPSLRRVFRIDATGEADDFDAARAAMPAGLTFTPENTPDAECAYLHTGGTTATPKLVRHTHGGQLLQGWLCGTVMGSDEDGVVGHAMPNFHVGGAVAAGARGIVFAQTLITLTAAGFRNASIVPEFWNIVARTGMTSITTAPTTAAAILDAGGDGPATLRQFTTGGGPQSPTLTKSFADRYCLPLREVWGGTEFHGILSFHYAGDMPPRAGSCGRVVPYHRVIPAVLDGSRFVREAGPDERGILIACGPSLIPGYVDPAADAAFFIEGGPDGLRWATTGDVGTVDADGYVWIFGREKDVIIRGGHNIDSALIDDALATHPAVLFAAAVGKPCPAKGELPMVYIQLRPGAVATTAELQDHARATIQERAAVPVEIVLIETMPMTAVGKVSKPPLRLAAIDRVARAIVAEAAAGEPFALVVEERAGRAIASVRASSRVAETVQRTFEPYTFATEIVIDEPVAN